MSFMARPNKLFPRRSLVTHRPTSFRRASLSMFSSCNPLPNQALRRTVPSVAQIAVVFSSVFPELMKTLLVLSLALLVGCSRPSADSAPTYDSALKVKADGGDLQSQLTLGNQYLDNKDNERGRKYMLMAAEQGSVDALNNLGYIERGTTGEPVKMREALKWHRIAEILSGRASANVTFDKRDLDSGGIQYAEKEAKKWLEARPAITPK